MLFNFEYIIEYAKRKDHPRNKIIKTHIFEQFMIRLFLVKFT